MVHSTFSLLFFFLCERAIVSRWLFFFRRRKGLMRRNGVREREVSRCARCFSPRRLALVSFSRVRQNSFRARALLPRIFFAPKRRSRARLSSRQSSCFLCFVFDRIKGGERRERRPSSLFSLLPFFIILFFFSLPHRKNSLLLLLLLLLLFVNAKNTDPSLLFLLVLLSSQLRRLS